MTQAVQKPGTRLLEKILEQLEHQTDSMDALCARLETVKQSSAIHTTNGNGQEGQIIEFDAEEIVTILDDSGTRKLFRIKGGQFSTYGLRVWPEVLETLGFEPELMELGSTPFQLRVAARVGIQGKQKVIGIAGGAH
jgi:hypothetical protein